MRVSIAYVSDGLLSASVLHTAYLLLIQQEELGMAGRKRFRDDQILERRDMTEDQKRIKAESKSPVSSEVASCPRETALHRSASSEGDEGDDSGSSAYSTEWLESLMLASTAPNRASTRLEPIASWQGAADIQLCEQRGRIRSSNTSTDAHAHAQSQLSHHHSNPIQPLQHRSSYPCRFDFLGAPGTCISKRKPLCHEVSRSY